MYISYWSSIYLWCTFIQASNVLCRAESACIKVHNNRILLAEPSV